MQLTREQSNWLKLIAVLLMIIDHIGAVFFPGDMAWRIIGRLAFPIFAYQLAVGFQYTSNRKKQWLYLMVFAVISQVPYNEAFDYSWTDLHLNVFATFAIGYALLMLWDMRNKIPFVTLLIVVLFFMPPVDYGIYGILMPLAFYLLRDNQVAQVLVLILATYAKSVVDSPLQVFAIFAIGVIILVSRVKMPAVKVNKWFFYWFYPVHLALFAFAWNEWGA